MGVLDSFRNGLYVGGRPPGRQRAVPHESGHVGAIDIIHHQEMLSVVNANFVDANDIRMMKAAGRYGFDTEAPDHVLAGHRTEQQHLDGDNSVEAFLTRPVNDTHAAPSDFLKQFVIAKRPGRVESHGRLARKRLSIRIRDVEIGQV
jgi:hypothetical protein